MPRGGRRPGAGRPKGAATRRTREIADAAMANPKNVSPLEHMLATLSSPYTSQARKDKAAAALLPFLHPRLSAVMTSSVGGQGGQSDGASEATLRIFSVPRGSSINVKTGEIVFPEGVEPQEIEPFKGTRDWTKTALTDQRPEPIVEPIEVVEIDTSNVVRLSRRDSEDEPGPSDAA